MKKNGHKQIKSIRDLQPDTLNANKGTPRGLQMVEDSLRRYGAGRSILADKKGRIIAGNKTLQSAADIDLPIRVVETDGKELVVVQRTDLDLNSKKARELGIADNRSSQVGLEWDASVLAQLKDEGVELSGMFTEKELAQLLPQGESKDAEPQIDKAAELQQKWQVVTGEIIQIGAHRLVCGDSGLAGDVFRLMGVEKADFIVTSPPYNVGVDYKTHDDSEVRWEDYEKFLVRILDEIIPCLDEGRAIAWNIGTSPKTHHVRQHLLLEDRYQLTYYRQMIWKKVGVPVPLWFNTVNDPVARRFTPNYLHEIILLFTKGSLEVGAPITIDDLCASDVFEYGQQFATTDIPEGLGRTGAQSNLDRRSRKAHPAAYPVRIPSMFMSHLSGPDEIVLDPFTGAGATMVAAENLGRRCYGMEISPEYCAVTLERMTTAFPHLKVEREAISRAA